jgi:hypothetical protein
MKPENRSPKKSKSEKKVRQEYQKKPSRKGIKSLRGKPELYDEVKKIVSICLTPTALAGLDKLSKKRSISRSELIERVGRYLIELSD